MAKRPPSTPEAEDDVMKAVEAAEAADVQDANGRTEPVLDGTPSDPPAMAETQEISAARAPYVETAEDRGLAPEQPSAAGRADPVAPPPALPAAKSSGGGFLGTALGGVVAAAAGYALSIFVPFPGVGVSDAPDPAQLAAVQALEARVAAVEAAPEPDQTLSDRVTALEQRPVDLPPAPDLSALTSAIDGLVARVEALEARPAAIAGEGLSGDAAATITALQAEVESLKTAGADATAEVQAAAAEAQARLEEAQAQAAALQAEAEATARKARASAAAGRVLAALESGAPFAAALRDLDGVEVPAALTAAAETGVPTNAALVEAFAPAARLALEESLRANMGESWSDRISSFLRTTTGARSLTPREGPDPDAVLSRAEAAARAGDLGLALTEVQGLPPEGLAAMSDWSAMAQQRLDALAAAEALTAAVEG